MRHHRAAGGHASGCPAGRFMRDALIQDPEPPEASVRLPCGELNVFTAICERGQQPLLDDPLALRRAARRRPAARNV